MWESDLSEFPVSVSTFSASVEAKDEGMVASLSIIMNYNPLLDQMKLMLC